ncbi:hypothetical protein [Cognatishimia sp. F0-27]|uniref:hypothetical protein n=1 Tax=Cognatishimia sp. F0-27 TaxID=2816855 RepID=UPI001D0C4546|nr:hypothetical protein [Cognatishimia sp. F0-27]MCC1494522.1 hypothetical protein [Cognatishimia sp. F0-27]
MGQNRISKYVTALVAGATGLVCVAPVAALAQVAQGALTIEAATELRGGGWSQITNIPEMLDFALTLLETTLLTALLVFHPAHFGRDRTAASLDIRKGMFLYSFIGMLTGFLVLHHGYLIGFVIFGIGGLFRFRMGSTSITDTGKLVIVALIGLATGLDLPVMALIAAVAAWGVIWIFGRAETLALEVKFDEKADPHQAMLRLREHLAQAGFAVGAMTKTRFKPVAQYSVISRRSDDRSGLIKAMTEVQGGPDAGVVDWHLD